MVLFNLPISYLTVWFSKLWGVIDVKWLRIIWWYHMVSLTVRIQNLFLSLLFLFSSLLFPIVEWLKAESMWMLQKIPTINGHVLPPFISNICKTKMLNFSILLQLSIHWYRLKIFIFILSFNRYQAYFFLCRSLLIFLSMFARINF